MLKINLKSILYKRNQFLVDLTQYASSSIISSAFNFLIVIFLASKLNSKELGIIAMYQLLVSFVTLFYSLNIDNAVQRKYFDNESDEFKQKKYLVTGLYLLFFNFLIGTVFFLAARKFVITSLSITTSILISGLLSSFLAIIIEARISQWKIRGMAKQTMTFQIIYSFFSCITTFIIVYFLYQNVIGRVISVLLINFIFAIIAIISLHKDHLIKIISFDKNIAKDILKFAIPLFPHSLGILLLTFFDRFIVKSNLGLQTTGAYVFGAQIVGILGVLFESLNSVIIPWLYKKLNSNLLEDKIIVVRSVYKWYFLIFTLSLFAIVLVPLFIKFFYGNKFLEILPAIVFLIIGQLFSGMYMMQVHYIMYANVTKMLSIITIASGGISIILSLILVNSYGVVGVAFTYAVSNLIRLCLTWLIGNKMHPMPWLISIK